VGRATPENKRSLALSLKPFPLEAEGVTPESQIGAFSLKFLPLRRVKERLHSFSKIPPPKSGACNNGESKRGFASLKKSLPPLLYKERGPGGEVNLNEIQTLTEPLAPVEGAPPHRL